MSECRKCKVLTADIGFDTTYGELCPDCLANEVARQIVRVRELETELSALRSQIVVWKPGGGRGADISALDGMLQIVAASRPAGMDLFIEVLTIHRGKDVWFSDSSGDHYNWTWERIDWFCHRYDFPLPQPPVTER